MSRAEEEGWEINFENVYVFEEDVGRKDGRIVGGKN